jgi:cell division protein FtsI/penicillin-binding protein 2
MSDDAASKTGVGEGGEHPDGIGLRAPGSPATSGRGWPGSSPVLKLRRRRPRLPRVRRPSRRVGLTLVLVAVAGIAVAAVLVLRRSSPNADERTARDFVAAWDRGDVRAMQRMTTPGASVSADLATVLTPLHITKSAYRLDAVTERHGQRVATFTVTDAVAGITWRYQSWFLLEGPRAHPMVRWGRSVVHPKLTSPTDVLSRSLRWATRAPILGANGELLAGSMPTVTIGIEPRRMTDKAALERTLQEQLKVAPATVEAALSARGVTPTQFVPIITVPRPVYDRAKPAIYPVPGLEFHADTGYANVAQGFAGVLLGRVGPITAEQLKTLGGAYDNASVVGQSGLQAAYERSLAGTPTVDIQVVDTKIADATRNVVAAVKHADGTAPAPLRTTIDPSVQQAADAALAGVTQPSALVALDANGNVRAVVSGPTSNQFDRALLGRYPPGSTFKVITATALLGAGLTPGSVLSCPPTISAGGRTFHNFEEETRSSLSFAGAFALSCNTAFIGATTAHLSETSLSAAARLYGFDLVPHLGLTTEGGSFPPSGDAVETAADAIGQGKVTASPLQMASVAAAVMSGQWHSPTLLPDHTSPPTGGPLPGPLDPNVRTALATMMRGVVTGGTGTAANAGPRPVSGKTGTAEFGNANPPQTHAWFIGFDGSLAVAVIVEGGGVGGRVAAPLAAKFFGALP